MPVAEMSYEQTFRFEKADLSCKSDALDGYKKRRGTRFYLYRDLIAKYSDLYGVDKDLIFAMAIVESALNPKAKSWVGAEGLLQIMPATKKELYKELNIKKDDLDGHVQAAVYYYSTLKKRFLNKSSQLGIYGPRELSIMSYNMGPNWTARRIKRKRPIIKHRYVDKVSFYHRLIASKSPWEKPQPMSLNHR